MSTIRILPTCALLLLLLFSTGCLGPRFARCPAEGGLAWRELQSEHFTLQTDLPADEAAKASKYLEQTRAGLLAAAWPAHSRKMARVTVYVMGERSDFEALFPRRVGGLFMLLGTEPSIVLPGRPDSWAQRFSWASEDSSSKLKHELAHHLSRYMLLRQPSWLSEGLAEFLSTLRLSADGRTAVMGVPHVPSARFMKQLLEAKQNGTLRDSDWSMQRVIQWDPSANSAAADWEITALYAGSWLLVHWLYNTQPENFGRYQALLAQGKDPARALAEVLPLLSSAELDATLRDYLRRGAYQELTAPVPFTDLSFVERDLEDSEVHALRAKLAMNASSMYREGAEARRALGRAEIDEALRRDPHDLLALELKLAEASAEERLPLARAAVKARPEEAQSWMLLAQATPVPAEVEAAYEKALALAPRNALAANNLAWLYVTQGRHEKALPLAERAVELAPWSASHLDTYAMAAAGLGRCAEARLAEQRALDIVQAHAAPELKEEFRARLASFDSTGCTPAKTP